MCYATKEQFYNLFPESGIPESEIQNNLEAASVDIDALTFNRISKCGFDNLTEFQKEKIMRGVCRHTQFRFDNDELIDSVISSYSLNGASVTIDTGKIVNYNGVITSAYVFSELSQSGLCCRRL